jgi:hypothetical protein
MDLPSIGRLIKELNMLSFSVVSSFFRRKKKQKRRRQQNAVLAALFLDCTSPQLWLQLNNSKSCYLSNE